MENLVMCRNVNDALEQVNKAEYGAHYMIVYPDLTTQRELYSNYTGKQIEENNEIVLINPFYETTDSVRKVLSGIEDVSRYEKEESLMIADALEEYFGDQPLAYVKKSLANYAKTGKRGISVLADLGAYSHKSKYKDLVDYELSLPTKYDVPIKGLLLVPSKRF